MLKLRVILDDKEIYELQSKETLVIEVKNKVALLQVTDGYHSSRQVRLTFDKPSYYRLKVDCALEDAEIYFSVIFLVFFYLMAFLTGNMVLKLVSFSPLVYLLFRYYINRKEFLKISQA